MIVSRACKRVRDPESVEKSKKAVEALFNEADVNDDGELDFGEWIMFSAKVSGGLKEKYGGSYTLNEA
jgi:Ca2+-binding EF-hand superfamily protein